MMPFNKNPQQLAMNLLQQNAGSNPMLANLLSLAQQGKTADIETIVRNLCKEKGVDFDKEFMSFKKLLGL